MPVRDARRDAAADGAKESRSRRSDSPARPTGPKLGGCHAFPAGTNLAAQECGRMFGEFRRAGRVIQQIDVQIGAARPGDSPARSLYRRIPIFLAIPGIFVENWAS